MAYNDFVTNILNADRDAIDLGHILNDEPNKQVPTRLGRLVWTIATINERLDYVTNVTNQKLVDLDNAINTAAAAGAGANGWTDLLIELSNGRTQRDKNSEIVSVLDFGVKADSSTNDATALQNYANNQQLKKNTTSFMPMRDRNYVLKSPVVYQEPCMIMGDKAPTYDRGQGTDGWILVDKVAGFAFDFGNQRTWDVNITDLATKKSQNPADQWTIKNIGIKPSATDGLSKVTGIKHTAKTNGPDRGLRVIECSFIGLDKAVHITNQNQETQLANLVVEGCVMTNCNIPIFADGNTLGARIVGNQIEQNASGAIHGTFNSGVTIADNMLEGQANTINITVPSITGNRPKIEISANYFEANSGDYLIQVDASTSAQLIIERNYHFNINNATALANVVIISGAFEYIRNTDDFKLTFKSGFTISSGGVLSRNGYIRVMLDATNKAIIKNIIINNADDLRLADSSYSQLIADRAYGIETNLGKLAYITTANNYVRVNAQITQNDAVALHIAYYDELLTNATEEDTIQIFNSTFDQMLAEGAVLIENSNSKVKVITLHFIASTTSPTLVFRILNRSDIKILGVAVKKLGESDGTSMTRFDSSLVTPRLVNLSDIAVNTSYDPPSIAANGNVTTEVILYGAKVGDLAAAAFSNYDANIDISAVVSAADTVTVKFKNNSAGAIDLASGTLTVKLV